MLLNQTKTFSENILSYFKVAKLTILNMNSMVESAEAIKNKVFGVLFISKKLQVLKNHVDFMNKKLNKLEQAIQENNKYQINKGTNFNKLR